MIPSSLRAGMVFFDDLEACRPNKKIGNIGGAVRAAPPIPAFPYSLEDPSEPGFLKMLSRPSATFPDPE